MRFLLEADQAELVDARLALLVRKAVGAQWSRDAKVKFKQAELDNDDLEDLFVDVKAHATAVLAVVDKTHVHTQAFRDPKAVGAVEYLVSSDKPFTWFAANRVRASRRWVSTFRRSTAPNSSPTSRARRPNAPPPRQRFRHHRQPDRLSLTTRTSWAIPRTSSTSSRPRPRPSPPASARRHCWRCVWRERRCSTQSRRSGWQYWRRTVPSPRQASRRAPCCPAHSLPTGGYFLS
jgi:hypothetical protein